MQTQGGRGRIHKNPYLVSELQGSYPPSRFLRRPRFLREASEKAGKRREKQMDTAGENGERD